VTESLSRAARRLTEKLVRIESVSPSAGESRVASALGAHLARAGLKVAPPRASALADGRRNLYAVAPGRGRAAVVFLGHTDTVGVADFAGGGTTAADAFRPERLAAPAGFLRGRGVLDMKSGLAAAAVAAAARARSGPRRGSVVVCAVADEENESAGIRHALPRLARMKRRLDLRGVVNVDYVTRTESGRIPVYAGTVGKMLAGVFARGLPAHAGDPLRGLDAGLLVAEAIREIDLDPDLGDRAAAPPALLRFGDLMGAYNVQTPHEAFAFFNVLFRDGDPRAILSRFERALRRAAESARRRLARRRRGVLARIAVRRWSRIAGRGRRPRAVPPGADGRVAALDAVRAALRGGGGGEGACLVLFLAPPFYPPDDGSRSGALIAAFERAVEDRDEFEVRRFYPYVSDLSLLSLSRLAERALEAVEEEMPVGHGLPVADMRRVGLPALNVGPVGTGAHEKSERVETRFAFDALPEILLKLAGEIVAGEGGGSRRVRARRR